jgi:hypothetical protein
MEANIEPTFTGLGDAMTEAESSNPVDTLEPSEVEEDLSFQS